MRRTTRARRTARAVAAAAAVAFVALGVAGCSSIGSEDSDSGGSVAAEGTDSGFADLGGDTRAESAGGGADEAPAAPTEASGADATTVADTPGEARSLIKTGNVTLHSDDVARARFDIQSIVDRHRGEVSDRATEADEDGVEARARLVLRVPVSEFDAAIQELEGVGDLVSSDGAVEDVTTQVIDTDVRVELQKRSIDRISVLLDRATSIRDIVSIERELSQREADLGSLEKRQTFLADQTEMGTITVSVQLPPQEGPAPEKDDDGFLAGLAGGWSAFTSVTVGLLTGAGAVLPFAVLLLLIGVPARLLYRRHRANAPAIMTPPPTDAPQGA